MSKDGNGRHQNPPFRAGDVVRLTEMVVRGLNKSKMSRRVHWGERTGTIAYCNDYDALVLWSGRSSRDPQPVRALELVRAAT